jgi:hypothetical protein
MRAELQERLTRALFSKPLIVNSFRGIVVEAIIALALEPEWQWMADGWGEVDFRNSDGVGLEVKQSAALQNWHEIGAKPCSPRFDIAARTGYWDANSRWHDKPGRNADVYVFAWNPETDRAMCDHRDPAQWEFYVIAARDLPLQKSIGLAGLATRTEPVSFGNLKRAVVRAIS